MIDIKCSDRNHSFRKGFSCKTQLTITVDELCRNLDKGLQTDVAILDFSKAFDKVPHDLLLYKLDCYGIRGNLHAWIKAFLTNRQMRVIVENEASAETTVHSGVPQGTVLGPLLFLVHINDLPDRVRSSIVRLFADDCLLYRTISTLRDHVLLQEDLRQLEAWASDWGMHFNASKCYVLSINNKTSYYYQLNNTILQNVDNNPYLGLLISKDLKWANHIEKVSKKASSTLGFIQRNLRHCPSHCRRSAYIALVRSTLEYGSVVWDPHLQQDVDKLEKVQRKAARFIKKDYHSCHKGAMTNMLHELDLPTLQSRRKENRLCFMYKISKGLVPAIPATDHLTREVDKRQRKENPKYKDQDYETTNYVTKHQRLNSNCYKTISGKTTVYRNSFFPRTIFDWNQLGDTSQPTTDSFRKSVQRTLAVTH